MAKGSTENHMLIMSEDVRSQKTRSGIGGMIWHDLEGVEGTNALYLVGLGSGSLEATLAL